MRVGLSTIVWTEALFSLQPEKKPSALRRDDGSGVVHYNFEQPWNMLVQVP